MELIDKSKIVAEIERVRMNYGCIFNEYDAGFSEGRCSAFDEVLSLLGTLEVKEVDLEKEIRCNHPQKDAPIISGYMPACFRFKEK